MLTAIRIPTSLCQLFTCSECQCLLLFHRIDVHTFYDKCYAVPPCLRVRSYGDLYDGEYLCASHDHWKCEYIKLKIVETYEGFKADWVFKYPFNEWVNCEYYTLCSGL